MLLRQLPRLCRSLTTEVNCVSASTTHRDAHTAPSITDPPPQPSTDPAPPSISLAHPQDPQHAHRTTANSLHPASHRIDVPSAAQEVDPQPVPSSGPASDERPHIRPPFHTYQFFAALEKTFPTETARGLMQATRALLVDRLGKVRRDGLTTKDLDNQAYLFRAALSELRAGVTVATRNESASMKNATAASRREVDRLDVKMKEDIGALKHEIQMELDTRKNEARTDLKRQDILIEEVLNKSIVAISDLRTDVEGIKWENMRRSVLTLGAFLLVIIISMELHPKPEPPKTTPSRTNRKPSEEDVLTQ